MIMGMCIGCSPYNAEQTVITQAIAVLRKYGQDAHIYLPGAGMLNGLTAANYLDSAGTTQGTVDQPVGLVLDAAGGLGVGIELVRHGSWADNGNGSYTKNTLDWGPIGGYQANAGGKMFKIEFKVDSITAGSSLRVWKRNAANNDNDLVSTINIVSGGTYSVVSSVLFEGSSPTLWLDETTFLGTISNISVREVTGIAASQPTTASKPILRRGAVNIGFPSSGNSVLWPTRATYVDDGTKITLAGVEFVFYKLAEDGTTASSHFGVPSTKPLLATTTYTASYYVKAGGRTRFRLEAISTTNWNPSTPSVTYNLSDRTVSGSNGATGTLTEIESGVFRVTWTATTSATAPTSGIYPVLLDANGSSPYNGDGASGIYITGYQLEVGAAANTYIPTTTAAASSSSGPQYWQFDSSNDSLSLGGPLFQMADDHCVIVGAMCGSSAGYQDVFSVNGASSNPKVAQIEFGGGSLSAYWQDDAGTSQTLNTSFTVGSALVLSVRRNSGVSLLRKNGAVSGTSSTPLGATTLTTTSIGCRGLGPSNFMNGNIYPVIAIKGTVPDSDLLLLEKFVGQLSGVQI